MPRRIEPGVVASILERSLEATVRALEAVPARCSFVEVRADRLRAADIEPLIRCSRLPVIVTVRGREDGGFFDGSTEERREILDTALRSAAAFVDVEWNGPLRDLATGSTADRVVLSDHGTPCDVDSLRSLYRSMAATPAALLKIVPRASSAVEACRVRGLLDEARSDRRQLASFTLGHGAFTRIFALSWGSWATYAAVTHPTAAGQQSAHDLLDVYDVTRLGPSTRRHALVGRGVDGSPSPALHAAAYREAGIEAVLVPVEASEAEDVLPLLGPEGALGIQGLAITIPLKESVALRSELRDVTARRAKAINTARIGPGGIEGFSTDGPAARDLIGKHLDPAGARVAIVGAGGTARAVAAALADAGASVTLYARDRARVEGWARRLEVAWGDLATLPDASWDVLVQATPLGREGERIVPGDALRGRVVLDAVYGPAPTPLVCDARARGLAVVDGYELLVSQAVLQIEILTGRAASRQTLDTALRAWLVSRRPLDGHAGPE